MPGFDVTPVEPAKQGLLCGECGLLLREAVQTEAGERLCSSCHKQISATGASKNGIRLDAGECYLDRAVNREIQQLLVKCNFFNDGCPWTNALLKLEAHIRSDCEYIPTQCPNNGCTVCPPKKFLSLHAKKECSLRLVLCEHCRENMTHNKLESHHKTCKEFPVPCSMCSQLVRRHSLEQHILHTCYYVLCPCREKVVRQTFEAHLSNPASLPAHMKLIMTILSQLQTSHSHIQQQAQDALAASARGSSDQLVRVEEELRANRAKMSALEEKAALQQRQSGLEVARLGSLELQPEASAALRKRMDAYEEQMRSLQRQVVVYKAQSREPQENGGAELERYAAPGPAVQSGGGSAQLQRRVENLERQTTALQAHVAQVELQLQASLASTHNGIFLWRIPDVARRRRDAAENRVTSIYSPPFYTARNGYKMCLRAYLNGDGIANSTHLSLFFVLMKGEYDPLLRWPFQSNVSLMLVDQAQRKHIVQTFKPNPDSSSFQRPTAEMNVASGCPQLAKLDLLNDSNYAKDDVMYIKCIVDVSRLMHP